MSNLASDGSEEVQMMSSEGGKRERERIALRTALPIFPVVPVRASMLMVCLLEVFEVFGYFCIVRWFGLTNEIVDSRSPAQVFISHVKSTIINNLKHNDTLLWGFMGRMYSGIGNR